MARTKAFNENEVLVKAQELFWKKGYHATSISDLNKHLGISKSSIYETFGNKDDLFLKSLNFYLGQNQHAEPIKSLEGVSMEAFIQQFLEAAIERAWSDQERKGCFAANCTVELAAHEVEFGVKVKQILNANFEHFVENWTQYFKDQQLQGQLSKEKDPKAMAQFLFATLNSINMISRKTSDKQVLFNIAQTAVQGIAA
ncbi:MAG: TetR/AcrR family transcriptional regulator [Bacteroidota bacterium]